MELFGQAILLPFLCKTNFLSLLKLWNVVQNTLNNVRSRDAASAFRTNEAICLLERQVNISKLRNDRIFLVVSDDIYLNFNNYSWLNSIRSLARNRWTQEWVYTVDLRSPHPHIANAWAFRLVVLYLRPSLRAWNVLFRRQSTLKREKSSKKIKAKEYRQRWDESLESFSSFGEANSRARCAEDRRHSWCIHGRSGRRLKF